MARPLRTFLILSTFIILVVKVSVSGYELLATLLTHTVPPTVARFGANILGLWAAKFTTVWVFISDLVNAGFPLIVLLLIFQYKWLGSIWDRINDEYLPRSRGYVKAAAFMGSWYAALAIVEFFNPLKRGNQASGLLNLLMKFLLGLGMGALFHRTTKMKSRLAGALILASVVLSFTLFKVMVSWAFFRMSVTSLPLNARTASAFALAKAEGFPESKLYSLKGMDNAFYFNSLVDEMIVIGTPLLKKSSDQINGVLAHELGHRAHKHAYLGYAWMALTDVLGPLLGQLWISSYPGIYEAVGVTQDPLIMALPVGELMAETILAILKPLNLWRVRAQEYEADKYATSKGHGEGVAAFLSTIIGGLRWNVSAPYEALFLDHPGTLNRVDSILRDLGQKN